MDQEALRPYLEPGERVLWKGRPARGFLLRASDIFYLPVFLGSAVGMYALGGLVAFQVWMGGLGFANLLYAIIFFVGALYAFPGRYVLDAVRRHWTIYVVTDRRAIILENLGTVEVTFRRLTPDQRIRPVTSARGNILIGPESELGLLGGRARSILGAHRHPFCFERLPDAPSVYKTICKAQAGRVGP